MPKLQWRLAALVQTLADETLLAETLLFPGLSILQADLGRLRSQLGKRLRKWIKELPPGEAWRCRIGDLPQVQQLEVEVAPVKDDRYRTTAVTLRLHYVQWQQGMDAVVAYFPALQIEIIAVDEKELAAQLLPQVRSALSRQKTAAHLKRLVLLDHRRQLQVRPLSLSVGIPTLKQAAVKQTESEAKEVSPQLQTHLFKLTIEMRGKRERQAKCRGLFVTFSALERRIAFSPSIPHVWFEYQHADDLEDAATRTLTHYFREQDKAAAKGHTSVQPEEVSIPGQAWVSTVDLEVNTRPFDEKKMARAFAALLDDTRVDGSLELQRVGRCLDWLYPAELHRAVGREREVAQLFHLLDSSDNRPIAIVGPRLVGKTTVLHETVRRRVARRGKPYAAKQNVWLLSPQRLISGMMYVGQWEGRLQAILKVAHKQRHVLYFDDFLGMYRAGISRDASLCAADVIKPFIHRREVRVLTEMTSEAWQTFCERDRGLADQFHVIRIAAMGEEETRRVMLQVQRGLEQEHHLKFDLTALPAILQLQQGRSAAFVRHLFDDAAKAQLNKLTQQQVLVRFQRDTGLPEVLLRDDLPLPHEEVLQHFRTEVLGQESACAAAAGVVTALKSGLNDPNRPLGVMLFCGPTGVGKTEMAKALSRFIFGAGNVKDRLVRLDMSEYASFGAAQRLFQNADGQLSEFIQRIRRQPFVVVLFDEIEKAAPEVLDALLGVLDEGRLTDRFGRTTTFRSAVIVLTSNVGADRNATLGFDSSAQPAFERIAMDTFRPEFFNRIDSVITFQPLSPETILSLARRELSAIAQREGLAKNNLRLEWSAAVVDHLGRAGYDARYGARPLQRAVERLIIAPLAKWLLANPTANDQVVHVDLNAAGAIEIW